MDMPINKKIPYLGLLLSFALILSYIEFLIPINLAIPGIKIGLANLAVLITIYLFNYKDAIIICVLKSLLSCILFGNMVMALYSIFGAIISCIIMILAHKYLPIHILSVSAIGGVFHNMSQLFIGYILVKSSGLFYYIPILILSGLIFGLVVGYIAYLLLPIIKRFLYKGDFS